MESTFYLGKDELTIDFLNNIKGLFKNAGRLQISVSGQDDFDLYKTETNDEYFFRLEKAISGVDENKISFTEDEFDNLVKEHL